MISIEKRIWSLLNNAIEFASGIGMMVAITRLYSPDDAGVWFLFIAVFGLAGALRDALIQSPMVRHTTSSDETERLRALKSTFVVMLLFETATSITMVIIGYAMKNEFGYLLIYYPFYAVPNAWFRWQTFYLRSRLQVQQIFTANAVGIGIIIAGICMTIFLTTPLHYMILVLGVSSFAGIQTGMSSVPYRAMLRTKTEKDSYRSIRQYGLFGMLREATSAISSRIGLFYTSAFLSLHQTAMLGISQRFSQISLLPNNAFQSLLFPSLMRDVNEGSIEKAKETFETSIAQLLAMTLPFAAIGCVLSPWILEILVSDQYVGAWPLVVTYVLLSTVITPFGTAFGSMVTALRKPAIAFRVVLINSILNTLLGYLLVKTIGLPGVPMALFLTEIFGFCVIGYILRKMARVSFLAVFLRIPSVYAGAASSAIALLKSNWNKLQPHQK